MIDMKHLASLVFACALSLVACTSCTRGAAVSAITSSPLAGYSLVPTAGTSIIGEIDLFGVAVDAPGTLGIHLGRKSDRAVLYRLESHLEACEAIVVRPAGDDVEVVHLRGHAVGERFPFLSCERALAGPDTAPISDPPPRVLWRGR